MYMPRQFTEEDRSAAVAMARSAGVGHLTVAGPEGLESTPVPFVIADDGSSVRMHLARPNGVWRSAPCDALLVVPVIDAYISPGWYPSKQVDGKVVPTWNYEVVHLHGSLVAHDDAEWVGRQIRDLTAVNEAPLPTPWSVDDAPAEFIATMQRGIVGVELAVSRVEAKRKLSQNKSADDLAGAVDGLRAGGRRGAETVADAMERHRPEA
jgi:transcriptional regulator